MTPIPTPTEQKNRRQRYVIANADARSAAGLAQLLELKTSVVTTENTPRAATADRPKHLAPIFRNTDTRYRHTSPRHYPHSAHNHRA